jgi:hypothetical protein
MRKPNWIDGLQTFTSVSILAGLILVAYEIRQNNDLAEADAVRAMSAGWQQIYSSIYETDIASIHAKSIADPQNLTSAEILKMGAWLSLILNQYSLEFSMDRRNMGYDYGDVPNGTEQSLVGSFDYFFGNRFARSWYLENRFWIESGIVEIMDREYEARPIQSGASMAERIKSRLSQ